MANQMMAHTHTQPIQSLADDGFLLKTGVLSSSFIWPAGKESLPLIESHALHHDDDEERLWQYTYMYHTTLHARAEMLHYLSLYFLFRIIHPFLGHD